MSRMAETKQPVSHPGFVVLRQLDDGRWELIGEVERQPGLTARAARAKAIQQGGTAQEGERSAAVLRSEWRVALDW